MKLLSKKSFGWLCVLTLIILALLSLVTFYGAESSQSSLESDFDALTQAQSRVQTEPRAKGLDRKLDEFNSFKNKSEPLLKLNLNLSEESLATYREVNAIFFNTLNFTDERSFKKLVALGFPSEQDILFAQQYSTSELAQGLIGTVDFTKLHAQIEQNLEVSKSGLIVIGFANALSEYEAAIRYYHPTYRNGDSLAELSWPNDKVPALVSEQFDNLNYLQAAAKSDSAAGALVKAKFDIVTAQLAGSENIPDMTIEFLASAQRELGSTVIAEYVEANYPQQSKKFYSSIQALE